MKKIINWIIRLIVCAWAIFSLMLLSGEPVEGISSKQTAIVEGAALLSFLASVFTGWLLHKCNIVQFKDAEEE